ncbi:putative leucine-rich repeat receptor-like protein kinase IMK3 [Platanthera zijinensis]|uniref:Leucine-rich repeat receptor-like protein kinase IMK3 n=1 Tax=Platanthera zijinensis TaxID=2320716 RepID=A0AAP0BCM8_9ASPA
MALATSSMPRDEIIIAEEDYQGLQAFKHELIDQWGFLRSWNGTGLGACSGAWLGVKCAKGKVISIHLPWRGLAGRITEKIGQLTALRKLSLHDNSIGGQIPSAIGFLSDLRGLILFNNRFSGEIPSSVGNLLRLQTLDISNNLLSGKIPETISSSSKLYRLNLSYNNFSGEIPVGIARSPALTFFSLRHNALSGPIPDATAYQLRYFNLDENHLSGFIPTSLGKQRELREITLSNNQLNGSIPEEIGSLSMLEKFDISHNTIGGSFPPTLCNLSSLIRLNLAGNLIGDRLPESIYKLGNLSILSIKMNHFNGEIPTTMGNISSLTELDLSENNFTGEIPSSLSRLSKMTFLNVSDNRLSGRVPALLSERFNSSSFMGNIQLCGYISSTLCPAAPPANLPSPPSSPPDANLFSPHSSPLEVHRRRLSVRYIILIIGGIILAFLLLLCCVLLCFLVRKRVNSRKQSKLMGGAQKALQTTGAEPDPERDYGGKLVQFEGAFAFTADDLLCATAEIMGKSAYGTVYKATLEDGNQVAVKRLREKIVKNQKEFEAEVNVLGKIRHLNLLALRAYYLGPKGEKLLVFDFMPKGSLAAFLHARGPDSPTSWPIRMNIAMGIARGLRHLHEDISIVHGNLTSANVLLDDAHNAKIVDYGLSKLMTAAAANSTVTTATDALGYCAPELSKVKKATAKADVYSLGVIMLELLTGKSPGDTQNGVDLPQWVASRVKEEWTNEVFDLELIRENAELSAGDELLNTLKLALHCADPSPEARPEAREVLRKLEEIKPELATAGVEVAEGREADGSGENGD